MNSTRHNIPDDAHEGGPGRPQKYGFWGSLIGFAGGFGIGSAAGFWFIFTFALAVGLSCFFGRIFSQHSASPVSS